MSKPNLMNVVHALYCEPWLIQPAMHVKICDIVQQHITGQAHKAGGIAEMFEEEEDMMEMIDDCMVLSIDGVIGRKVSMMQKSSGVVDVNDVEDAIAMAAGDDTIQGVVLSIDSPGGTVGGVPELAATVRAMRDKKPIVAFVDGQASSAAYWIASQAQAIVAAPSSFVGSIGVYMAFMDVSRAMEMQGVKTELIKAGKFKGIGVQGTSINDEQRAMLQDRINELHSQFKAQVISGRGIKIEDEDMQGQEFTSAQAVSRGLVDTVGKLADAISLIKQLRRQ